MSDIFSVKHFDFPYTGYRFPGENAGERILFVTRESETVHMLHLIGLGVVCVTIWILGWLLFTFGSQMIIQLNVLKLPLLVLVGVMFLIGLWWIAETYRKSIFIITTRRLTKIIYTTPFTWYQFSLGLDEIQDTGSYGASFIEAIFGLGYFVARSGAGAVKNFKIVNITYARDLHNYVNKLLYAFKHHPGRINDFRPFIPDVKGEAREELFRKYPEYKTEFE